MWMIFKVFIEFVTILLLFFFFFSYALVFFSFKVCGILAPQLRIEPHSLHRKVKPLSLDHQGSPMTALSTMF